MLISNVKEVKAQNIHKHQTLSAGNEFSPFQFQLNICPVTVSGSMMNVRNILPNNLQNGVIISNRSCLTINH